MNYRKILSLIFGLAFSVISTNQVYAAEQQYLEQAISETTEAIEAGKPLKPPQ